MKKSRIHSGFSAAGNRFFRCLTAMLALLTALPVLTLQTAEAETAPVWDGKIADGFAGGTGTSDDPFQIAAAAQLAYLAQQVNGGDSFAGKTMLLTADIVLNDTTGWESWNQNTTDLNIWTAIGTETNSFGSTFDGDGHAVSEIFLPGMTGSYHLAKEKNHQGLFGKVDSAKISNVNVEKSFIRGDAYVGGVCGCLVLSTIENCRNSGTVIGVKYVGGVCGEYEDFTEYVSSYFKCINITTAEQCRGQQMLAVCAERIYTEKWKVAPTQAQ